TADQAVQMMTEEMKKAAASKTTVAAVKCSSKAVYDAAKAKLMSGEINTCISKANAASTNKIKSPGGASTPALNLLEFMFTY
ncbi:MAG: hypothetical protein RR540_08310, partial [Oscillospiraceae bacterium]